LPTLSRKGCAFGWPSRRKKKGRGRKKKREKKEREKIGEPEGRDVGKKFQKAPDRPLFFFLLGEGGFLDSSFFLFSQETKQKQKLLSKRPFFLARFPRSPPHPPLWFREGGGEESGGQTPGQKKELGPRKQEKKSFFSCVPLSPLHHSFRLGPPRKRCGFKEERRKASLLLSFCSPQSWCQKGYFCFVCKMEGKKDFVPSTNKKTPKKGIFGCTSRS